MSAEILLHSATGFGWRDIGLTALGFAAGALAWYMIYRFVFLRRRP